LKVPIALKEGKVISMNGKKKKENYAIVLLGWIFLVIGVLLIIGGAVSELIISRVLENREWVIESMTNTSVPIFKIVYCSIGGVFTIIGVSFLLVTLGSKKKKKKLIETGRKYYAEVTGAIINYRIQVNRRNPYRLDCRYIDEFTGVTYLYRSENVWENPDQYIGLQVPVYVNPNKPKEYYVAVDELSSSKGAMFCDYR
jgi:hypothetical protein